MSNRILIATGIFAPDIGGPASYARALGTRLAEQGVKVTVLTYSPVLRHAGDKALPFRVCRVWKRLPWGIRHAIYFFRALTLTRGCSGILLLNATNAGVPATVAARLTGTPTIVRVVGDYAWENAMLKGKTFLLIDDFQKAAASGTIGMFRRMQTWTCRNAAAVIVPSEYMARMVAGWGVPKEKISVIYNGVDLPVADMSKEEARRSLGITGNVLMSCGRLVPWKGFRMLIKLMPQLLQVNRFFHLIIVGDGQDMPMLRGVVRTLGLERSVSLVGRKNAQELARYLAAADIFILNTGYEGFSHQILEAMQAGVPVITTSVGGNREVIVQGENGLMVRYNDEFNLGEAIKTVWRQAELRERFIENAKQTVEAFSIERMYEGTSELLNKTFT